MWAVNVAAAVVEKIGVLARSRGARVFVDSTLPLVFVPIRLGAATVFSFVQSANQRTSVRAYTTRSHILYKCTEFTVVVSTELIVHLLRIGHACTVNS